MKFARKGRVIGLGAAVASVVASLMFAGPAGAEAPAGGARPIQVEAVRSATPVMVSDVAELGAQSTTETYYCAVRDGMYGCQPDAYPEGLVVAVLYQRPDFNQYVDGWRLIIFNPAYEVGCSGPRGNHEGAANLGGVLANEASSLRTYHNCDIQLFDGNGLTGAYSPWKDWDNNLETMDNRANSFRIS